jgi:hypothetical protein
MGERTPEPRESPLDRTLSNWFGDSPSVNEYSIFASPDRPPATRCSPAAKLRVTTTCTAPES